MDSNIENTEMTKESWDDFIRDMIKTTTPEKRAYLIIRNFFNIKNPSEKICNDFKNWFFNPDTLPHN